jgi:penicillin-binding protein 1A
LNERIRRIIKKSLIGIGVVFVATVLFLVGGLLYLRADLPTIRTLADYNPPQATKIYSDDGQLVADLAHERRTVVSVAALPRHVVQAFLAAEDEGFYEHAGLDYWGILRAAIKNLRPGAHLQGASTITQQTVKTMVLGPERSYTRKMREVLLARELETMLDKEGILHLYLNQIYFGSGAYGIEEAAHTYFDKGARELDLGEAAYIASIPKSPSHYTIKADPVAAKERQRYVLKQMVANGWADAALAEREIAEPVPAPPAGSPYLGETPHYVEQVRRLLVEKLGEQVVYEGGLTVYVGMNAKAQLAAQDALRRGLEDLARQHGWGGARVRIEVDRLERYAKALRQRYADEVAKLAIYEGTRRERRVWDLWRITSEKLANEDETLDALRLKPLKLGERVTVLVAAVDSIADVATLDLGGAKARLTLKEIAWAHRFTPTGYADPPRDIADVLNAGDLVQVDIANVPTRLAGDKSELVVKVELVPEPKAEGALVSIDPQTRYVRALVGGYRQEAGGLIRATQSKRQPGSAFKPIAYAAGLDTQAITPASICNDAQIVITDKWTGKQWKPGNYDGQYEGPITYRTALMKSKNSCSVKLVERIGPEKVVDMAHALGIESELPENLTLALGSGDVTPLELCNAYATIAAGGLRATPIFIRKVVDRNGHILEETRAEPEEALRPGVAYVLSQMMRSVIEEGTATRALVLDRPLAGKTGTSNESRNVWFGGFSRELVAVVWIGFDNNDPLGRAYGGSIALPVWIRYMGRALEGVPQREFELPDDVATARIDPATGRLSTAPDSEEMVFLAGTEPTESTETLDSIFIEDDERKQDGGLATP